MSEKTSKKSFGLEGIRVIEAATVFAGPTAGRFLADWGAEVIKVEHPVRGDIVRSLASAGGKGVGGTGMRAGNVIWSNVDYDMENHNRNKKSITLDMEHERGREVMYRLLKNSDVLVMNLRPREVIKFGLEYEILSKLNPRLISANITGFGNKGPDRDTPGYDFLTFWARSGMLHVMLKPGMDPLITPLATGDRLSALTLVTGIMTALYVRERTGLGQEINCSLFNTGVYAITCEMGGSLVTGKDIQQVDRKDILNMCSTFYITKDGKWLRLGMGQTDLYWPRFCPGIGRPDLLHDPRFDTHNKRIENRRALFEILEKVFLSRTYAEWREMLNKADVPWGPVQSLPDVINDPQARANDFFVSYDHPKYGKIDLVANPVHMSRTKETIKSPAPEFSQHTEEVLLESGYSWEEIAQLKDLGIVA